MSDVPELDKLIEESDNYRSNISWRKKDRFFKLSFSFMLFIVPIFLFFVAFFPSYVMLPFSLLVAFFVAILSLCFFDVMSFLFKDDWDGVDMTKRYQRK